MKKRFPVTDFRAPCTDTGDILTTTEKHFIVAKDIAPGLNNLARHRGNWPERVKHKTTVATIAFPDLARYLDRLDKNYRVLLSWPGNTKNRIYDCRPVAIQAQPGVSPFDLFIVDKKYGRFATFTRDPGKRNLNICRSGTAPAPFDT